jgi:hypothetical protein
VNGADDSASDRKRASDRCADSWLMGAPGDELNPAIIDGGALSIELSSRS